MSNRVINGLEGCSKSSNLFQQLQAIATPERPVVFAFKNYRLMREQVESWSSRFQEPKESFAICGFNKDYGEAKESFTNKENPWLIPSAAKFIFVSQALLQRNKIRELSFEAKLKGEAKPTIQHIVIDEFDFSMGIVPTLDYFVNHCPEDALKEKISKNICDFIYKNYTPQDVYNFQKSNEDSFNLAHWLADAECDITILTSEILATLFLQIIGFGVVDVGKKNFLSECKVFVASDKNIGRNFFSKMNLNLAWNKLGFGTVISDCIATGYKDTNSLNVDVVNHTNVRGSNAFMGKDVLTIVSYIPKSKIEEVRDCINCFVKLRNRDNYNYPYFTYPEVEALYYRDRMCQAIGRVIGYRGSVETHVLIHDNLLEHMNMLTTFDFIQNSFMEGKMSVIKYDELIKECGIKMNPLIVNRISNGINLVPYNIVPWEFEFEGKEDIWKKIDDANERSKKSGFERKKNFLHNKKAETSSNLDKYFEVDKSYEIEYQEMKAIIVKNKLVSITGKGMLQPMKVAKHFGLTIRKSNGKSFIEGIKEKV